MLKALITLLLALLTMLLNPTRITEPPLTPVNTGSTVDPRLEKLENFFNKFKCTQPNYAKNYISAADKFGNDYRLLPAISIIESECGKHQRLNNWWGWNSARTGFGSVAEGIEFVSYQLADGRYYKGLATDKKLGRYNSENPNYVKTVLNLMGQIDAKQNH